MSIDVPCFDWLITHNKQHITHYSTKNAGSDETQCREVIHSQTLGLHPMKLLQAITMFSVSN
eukprot:scaffold8044_cov142-Skeletonema_menzelii.AAC.5